LTPNIRHHASQRNDVEADLTPNWVRKYKDLKKQIK